MPVLIVDDLSELLALHSALFEARYHPNPERPEIQGSSILARLHSRLYEAILAADERHREGWERVRQLRPGSPLFDQVQAIIARPGWEKMDAAGKEAYVRNLIAPFEAEEVDLRALIDYGDSCAESADRSAGASDSPV